jgi:ribonucleoside-diphosphate reductase alpha chain
MPVGKEHRGAMTSQAAGISPAKAMVTPTQYVTRISEADDAGTASLAVQNKKLLGDAPACDNCGHITVRNGTCYKCLNCGSSMGCS